MHIKNQLRLSLAANAILFIAVIWFSTRATQEKAMPSAPVVSPPKSEAAPVPQAEEMTLHSATLGSSGWAESMAQLRRAGVPGAIIAKVVVEKIAEKWTPLDTEHERQYLHGEIDAKRLAEKHDQRAQEEERELRAALGDGYRAWDREYTLQGMYLGGLEPTEAQKEPLYALQKNWLKRLHELEVANRNGQLSDAAFETARTREEADYKTRLAGIIGRDRVDGMESASDPVAEVRQEFGRLQLSDSQLGELTAVQERWNQARAEMADYLAKTKTMDSAYTGDLQALERARDEEYRRVLGDEAFQKWQKAGDSRYRLLRENAQAWGLDARQIDQVYSAIRAYDLTVATLEHQAQVREQTGGAVDWVNVEDELLGYTNKTAADLRAFLGDERFNAMERQRLFGLRQSTPSARRDAK